ncbi:MAG: hypothetical protein AAF725_00335 [Acidobacteriota bacterium]
MSKSTMPGCFKYGCFGCASVIALVLGLSFLLAAVQFAIVEEDPRPEELQTERILPEPPPLPGFPGSEPPVGDPTADAPESVEIQSGPGPTAGVGTLKLDLQIGDFHVRPGPADEPLRVIADYDAAKFELKEDWQLEDNGEWTYEVSFGAKGGFLSLLVGGGNNSKNEVTVIVPRGHPMNIVGQMKMGQSKVDLGGLWLENYDLDYGMGEHFVEVREPLPFPMTSFRASGSMGELEIRGLGDASPAAVEVDHGMGDFFLDLKGAWRNDAEIEASFSMGACRLWVPEDAYIDWEGGSVAMGESRIELPETSGLAEDAPRLTLSVAGNMGEVTVEY